MSRVVLGMSGGVDSSAAAHVLLQQGHEVIGVTMNLWNGEQDDGSCCSLSAVTDAKRVADKLGIPFYAIHLEDAFEAHVIRNFIGEYQRGRTPNPCIVCNRFIKFGAMLDWAKTMGADYVATGHYARVEQQDGRYLLRRPADRKKDQTYFLYRLTQDQLARTLMPLWDVTKDETRRIAHQLGLDVANKPDSQEICFVPDGDYAGFIQRRAGKCPEGDFVDMDGNVVGRHKGIIHYTVGQRKGLGIALNRPVYVTKINPADNTVVLGEDGCQLSQSLYAEQVNFIPFDTLDGELACTAKIRYNAKEAPCVVTPWKDGIQIEFEQPQRAVTPGQAVVLYKDDLVIGGGTIRA